MVAPVAEQHAQQAPAPAQRSWDIPALDGVRGMAILLVLWCHIRGFTFDASTQWLLAFKSAAGLIGLYLFFVLSCFLLFLPYARALLMRGRWPSARRFYGRRMLRILPVFYAVLLVPLGLAVLAAHVAAVRNGLTALNFYVPPVPGKRTLLFLFALLHDLRADTWSYILQTNTPLWSLAIEWQFYLILPWLALVLRALHRRAGAAGLVGGLLGLMAYALGVRALAAATFYSWGYPTVMQVPGPLGFALTLLYGMNGKYLELFALGMLVSVAYVAARSGQLAQLRARLVGATERVHLAPRAAHLPLALTVLVIAVGLPLNELWLQAAGLTPTPPQAYVGRWPQEAAGAWVWSVFGPWALALCMAGLIVGALFGPGWLRAAWAWRPLRLLGLISYSLYVWHALLEHAWESVWNVVWPTGPAVWYVLGFLMLLIAAGTASYLCIERPFLRSRQAGNVPLAHLFTHLQAALQRR